VELQSAAVAEAVIAAGWKSRGQRPAQRQGGTVLEQNTGKGLKKLGSPRLRTHSA